MDKLLKELISVSRHYDTLNLYPKDKEKNVVSRRFGCYRKKLTKAVVYSFELNSVLKEKNVHIIITQKEMWEFIMYNVMK